MILQYFIVDSTCEYSHAIVNKKYQPFDRRYNTLIHPKPKTGRGRRRYNLYNIQYTSTSAKREEKNKRKIL